jgi:transcriptional regulator with XRE-family HTH domain
MSMATKEGPVGLELKLARIRLGLHLYEVARQVGITPARLSQFEGGHRRPPPDLEVRLRGILGLPSKEGQGDDPKS